MLLGGLPFMANATEPIGGEQIIYITIPTTIIEHQEIWHVYDDFLIPSRDYVFLIDRSGSMSGNRIRFAVEALKLFIYSIPMGSKFNIVSYGSKFKCMFLESVAITDETLKLAIN